MKKLAAVLASAVFAAVLIGIGIYGYLMVYADSPISDHRGQRSIIIERGDSFQRITQKLHQAGIIRKPALFRILARINGKDKRIQAGEYQLSSDMTPSGVLDTIFSGKVQLYRFTIPEGANIQQVADVVASSGIASRDAFTAAVADPDLLHLLNIPADTFEGYLFPDTYFFPKNTSAETIVTTMVERLRSVFRPEWKARAEQLGYSVHEILTLASIIEKETGVADERPLISSVFHNRLKKGIRLGADPTVIYGIKDFDGNLTRKHLRTPSPYNTYLIKGLPQGPIANPGAASIEAALFPSKTDFLYFVARRDATHHFSTNLKDHNRAVRKYQLRRR